jgi:hypothetical protein
MRKTNGIPITMEAVLNAGKMEMAQWDNGTNTCSAGAQLSTRDRGFLVGISL